MKTRRAYIVDYRSGRESVILGFIYYISFNIAAYSARNGAYSKVGKFRVVDLSRSRLSRRVKAKLRRFIREDI